MISDTVQIAIIACLAPILTALCTVYVTLRSSKKSEKKIDELHILVNSRMDELLAAGKGVSLAEGKAQGITEEREREERSYVRKTDEVFPD